MSVATVVTASQSNCRVLVGKLNQQEKWVMPSGASVDILHVNPGHTVPYGTVVRTGSEPVGGLYWKAVGTQGVGYDIDDLWRIKSGWMCIGHAVPQVVDHVIETEWYLNFRPDAPEQPNEFKWDDSDLPERRYHQTSRFISVDVAMSCPLYKGPEVSMPVPTMRRPGTMPRRNPGTVAVDLAFACPLYKGSESSLSVPIYGGGLGSRSDLAPRRGNLKQRKRMRARYVELNRGANPTPAPQPELGTGLRSAEVTGFNGNVKGDFLTTRNSEGDVLSVKRAKHLTSTEARQAWCDDWYRDNGFSPDIEEDLRIEHNARVAEAEATPLTNEELALVRITKGSSDNPKWDRQLWTADDYWTVYNALGEEGDGGFSVTYHPDSNAVQRTLRGSAQSFCSTRELVATTS